MNMVGRIRQNDSKPHMVGTCIDGRRYAYQHALIDLERHGDRCLVGQITRLQRASFCRLHSDVCKDMYIEMGIDVRGYIPGLQQGSVSMVSDRTKIGSDWKWPCR